MATKITGPKKPAAKLAENKFPQGFVWIFAIISIFVITIVYYEPALDVNLAPKLLALSIFLFLFYLLFGFNKKHKLIELSVLKRGAVLSWFALIVISIISLVKAVTPAEGLMDIFTRITSILFLIAAFSILVKTQDIKPFTIVAAVLSLTFSAIGYYEYLVNVFRKPSLDALYLVDGIYSHKNVYSAFLFLLVPFLFYELFRSKNANWVAISVVILLNLNLIFLLQTRSVWLSLFVFMVIFTLLIVIFRKGIFTGQTGPVYKKSILIFSGNLVLAIAISWLITGYSQKNPYNAFKRQKEEVEQKGSNKTKELTNLNQRAASIFDTKADNSSQRIEVWSYSLKMIKDNPILGVGAGNWKILIPSYFSNNYQKNSIHLWRRPHNDYVWILAEKGIFGIISYLAFLSFLLFYAIKVLLKSDKSGLKILVIIMLGGIAGYCTDSLFSFPFERIEHQIIVMFFAWVIIWVYHSTFPIKDTTTQNSRNIFITLSLLMLLLSAFYGNITIKSEKDTKLAYASLQNKYYDLAIRFVDMGYTPFAPLDPSNNPVLSYRGNAYMNLKQTGLAQADYEKSVEQNPYSPNILMGLAVVYINTQKYDQAIELLNRALKLYPTYREALINLSNAYYFKGDLQRALDYLYKCKREDIVDETLDNSILAIQNEMKEKERLKLDSVKVK